jgi:hypothetical protein
MEQTALTRTDNRALFVLDVKTESFGNIGK